MTNKKRGFGLLSREVNMTEGAITSSLIAYAIPLILSGVLQTLYNAADVMVIGNLAGKEAVASVGATGTIIGLLVNILTSISTGFNIIIARVIGANDERRIQRAISTAYTFSLILGVIIATVGIFMSRPLLHLTSCPDNVIDGATTYMQIYMLGVPASVFYNFMSCVIRVNGDSRRPFYYLAISGVVNIALNIILVLTTGEAVVSVAVATVVSVWLSALLLFIRLQRIEPSCRLNPLRFYMHGETLLKIVRLGIPSAISSATFALTNLQVQSAINSFGDVGIAGNTASISIENFLFSVTNTAGVVVSAFMGQNIGAGNRERTVKILYRAYAIFMIAAAMMGALCLTLGRPLLSLVIPGETDAIEFGLVRLTCLASVTVLHAVLSTSNGSLQAFGYTTLQMIVNLVGTCGLRFVWMTWIFPISPSALSLYICYPVSYAVVMILGFVFNFRIVRQYKKGKNFAI